MSQIRDLLDREAARINSPEFIADDPVKFPRMFTAQPDVEIAALLASHLAWGRRTQICKDCQRLFELMEWQPHKFLMEEGYDEIPAARNIHRTFFADDLAYFMRGLRRIYSQYPTLEAFALAEHIADAELPPWKLAEVLNREMTDANNGFPNMRCLPRNLKLTALKRLNMSLRWLVRDDGIVDMGVWSHPDTAGRRALTPSQLFIPMDVHVGEVARHLGLLNSAANNRPAVVELTTVLRAFRPTDPCLYDFALFGIGMNL